MLSLLALWAILGITFTFIGMPILHACNAQTCLQKTEDRIFVAVLLGMIVLANLLLLLSLFTALTLYVAAFFIALMLLPYLFKRYEFWVRRPSIDIATGAVFIAMTLLVAALAAIMSNGSPEDSGGYHIQMIKWLAEYGSVTGLALINHAFGYTDAWFALLAPLKSEWFKDHFIVGMNSFIFFMTIAQTYAKLVRVWNRQADVGDWFFIISCVLFCRYFFPSLIFSPSPDLPATLLIIVTTWLIIAISIRNDTATEDLARQPGLAVLVFASGAVSIKFGSMSLLGMAAIYYIYNNGFNFRKVWVALAVIAPFVTTHLLVSVITSGCPLYPMPYFCTGLPWSLGSENARAVSSIIMESARWVGPTPPDATRLNWLWHQQTNTNMYYDKPLLLGLLIVNILCIAWLYFKRKAIDKNLILFPTLIAISGIGLAVLWVPNLRFCLGYFLLAPSLVAALLLTMPNGLTILKINRSNRFMMAASIISVAGFSFSPIITEYVPNLDTVNLMLKLANQWAVMPWPPVEVRSLERVEGNNFLYYYPTDPDVTPGMCWDAPLPCAPIQINNVWLRDENVGLKSGFVKNWDYVNKPWIH